MSEIDVSKCIHKYYVDGEQICGIYESDYVECSKEDCYYKQLQQYKQLCQQKTVDNFDLIKENDRYKQCLDEIEEIAIKRDRGCGDNCLENRKKYCKGDGCNAYRLYKILQLIKQEKEGNNGN